MTQISAVQLSTSFLVPLATAAVRALLLAGAAGLGLAAFRVQTTSVRLFTWTAVLYAALAMPLLERLLPPLPIVSPAFLQYQPGQAAAGRIDASRTSIAPVHVSSTPRQAAPFVVSPVAPTVPKIRWDVCAEGIYSAVAIFLLVRFFVGLALGRRLRRASRTVCESRLVRTLAACAQNAGLSFIPRAADSEFISVPATMGIMLPVVLLPRTWREWDDAKLDAVIAHEISHITRHDALTQLLSRLHCTIFWFSPLAWWLNRHLADLVEQASDEAALARGADRKAYARTLLGFFEALQTAPGRVWWQGISIVSAGRAEQRVERILTSKGVIAMGLKRSIAVVVIALAVPLVYVAASAHPADRNEARSPQAVEVAQAQPSPRLLASPAAPKAKKSSSRSHYSYGYDDAESFAIVSGKSDSVTMSGTELDGEHLQELKKKIQGDFIWFRRGEKSYIVRDQATIDRARALWAPQEELGKKQEELGKQQEALGKQQEELGKKMEEIRVKVPDMTKEIENLQAKLKQLNSSATVEQIGEIQSEIGELQSQIGEIQSQAGEEQSKLGEEMGALGERQGELGEKQGELGRRQGDLAEQASRETQKLLNESISKGTAQLEQ